MQVSQLNLATRLRRIAPPLSPATAPLLGIAARSGPFRRLSLPIQAAKGFGKQKPTPTRPGEDEAAPARGKGKGKGKRVMLQPGSVGLIPGQQRPQQTGQDPSQAPFQTQLLVPELPSEEEDDFNSRLRALKAQGAERAATIGGGSAAAAAAATLAATPAIFDPPSPAPSSSGGGGSIYANPPPLSQTLLAAAGGGPAASDISDPKLRDANIGPSQLGLAVGAIIFVAVFLLVAAGDYAPTSRRYSGVRPAQAPPDPIEEKILKGKISLYEDQLKANPNNNDATEALATSYARMMQYDKASELLEKLSKRTPDDAEVWRLLGESSLLSQQSRKAVPAFERAVQLRVAQQPPNAAISQPDLQLLTGLVDAYIANSDYPKAIEALRGVREQLRAATSSSSGQQQQQVVPEVLQEEQPAAEASSSAAAAPEMLAAPPLTDDTSSSSEAAATPSQPADAGATSAATTSAAAATSAANTSAAATPGAAQRPLDPLGVELLTAKVYSAWRGHDQDALTTYDELTKAMPEDYRGYLAKGVFLKEKGRKADAERMFLQARFFAPASKQQLVRAIADSTPAAPQLPDNN